MNTPVEPNISWGLRHSLHQYFNMCQMMPMVSCLLVLFTLPSYLDSFSLLPFQVYFSLRCDHKHPRSFHPCRLLFASQCLRYLINPAWSNGKLWKWFPELQPSSDTSPSLPFHLHRYLQETFKGVPKTHKISQAGIKVNLSQNHLFKMSIITKSIWYSQASGSHNLDICAHLPLCSMSNLKENITHGEWVYFRIF